jgi:sarcosine oxidase, subunit beta
MLLGISNQDQEPGFCREFDYQWLPAFNRAAEAVAPSLANQELEVGWAGLYENTPDHNAMIGSSDSVEGFMYATGFSGHGFLQGPAVGELVRDMYLGRESFMDPEQFSAARFAGELSRVKEVHII